LLRVFLFRSDRPLSFAGTPFFAVNWDETFNFDFLSYNGGKGDCEKEAIISALPVSLPDPSVNKP
jgi:hypothetical protein